MAKLNIKICNIGQSHNERSSWATKAIGLIDRNSYSLYPSEDNYLTICVDDVSNNEDEKFETPNINHIHKILEYSKSFTEEDRILVHCHAGISRSTATAIGILIQHGYSPKEAFDYIYSVRPIMYPNSLFISLFDTALNMNGLLLQELLNWNKNNSWNVATDGIIMMDKVTSDAVKKETADEMVKFMKLVK